MNTPLIRFPVKTVLVRSGLAILALSSAAGQPMPEQYREPFSESFPIRKEQHLQIKAYADKLLKARTDEAVRSVEPDFSSLAAYQSSLQRFRDRLNAFFGTPPPGAKEGRVTKFQQVGEDTQCTVFRVWVEVIDGVDAYGIIKVAAPSGYFRDYEQLLSRASADDARASDREIFGGLGHFQAIALICPRPCLVQIGEQDGALNNMEGARVEAERAALYYRKLGVADRFQFTPHPGGHEFDTRAILDFFDRHL